MSSSKNPNSILLGEGVFFIGTTPIGLTRGGGEFTLEREIRQIEADGDRGLVKNRSVIDKSTPKLKINALEIINENLTKLYVGLTSSETDQKTKVTGNLTISSSDYHDVVKWVGTTKGGSEVVIAVENAINLENINWALVDKSEIVSALTYTGCYLEDSPSAYEPWSVTYA